MTSFLEMFVYVLVAAVIDTFVDGLLVGAAFAIRPELAVISEG